MYSAECDGRGGLVLSNMQMQRDVNMPIDQIRKVMTQTTTTQSRQESYEDVLRRIDALLEDETDWIAGMATVASELHHSFPYFHWTGFYRAVSDDLLVVGPYQGGHGCLRIPFSRGVCGAAATTRRTQLVPNVHEFPGHIACSSSTQSEIVVPVETPSKRLLAVLDVDSDDSDAFGVLDQEYLELLCSRLGRQFQGA